jgi:hypothetical protein
MVREGAECFAAYSAYATRQQMDSLDGAARPGLPIKLGFEAIHKAALRFIKSDP